MEILVNGRKIEIPSHQTILQLLEDMKIPVKQTVVEKNGTIVTDLNEKIEEHDQIEIIRMVGGG